MALNVVRASRIVYLAAVILGGASTFSYGQSIAVDAAVGRPIKGNANDEQIQRELTRQDDARANAPRRPGRVSIDAFGDVHYSRFNFTDVKRPYNGVDGYGVVRIQAWGDAPRRFGGYVNVIPVIATADEFFFQRHIEFDVGVQGYPFTGLLRSLRLFAEINRRLYYDRQQRSGLLDGDRRIGLDYYYDNLFTPTPVKVFAYSTLTYRHTNFSLDGYNAWLTSGNVKLGWSTDVGTSIIVPYVLSDWTAVPQHPDRFWENFLRVGSGLRWYPNSAPRSGWVEDVVRRFHFFAELVRNVAWLKADAPGIVESTDIRVGVGFATPGILRQFR